MADSKTLHCFKSASICAQCNLCTKYTKLRECAVWMNASVVSLSGFLATHPEVRISIPCCARFSKNYRVWNGVHSASWVQFRSYLEQMVAAPVQKVEITAVGICHVDHVTPLYPQNMALTSVTSGGHSVGTVCSRNQAKELLLLLLCAVRMLSLWP
jgi:hypothetical protein